MSISTALNNAMTGLNAASRGAAVVSGNIANALTPDYARRSLELTTSTISGNGVNVAGITRHQDPVLLADLRTTDADMVNTTVISEFHAGFENLVGTATDDTSIAARLSTLESSLITAASLPDSAQRLDDVARSARDLTEALNAASDGVRQMRSDADRTIGKQVDTLNQTLQDLEKLNARIPAVRNSGGDVGALLDQQQALINQVNEIVPVNAVARENDRVSLYSDGGLILLEGSAVEFSFSTTGETMPHMTVGNGLLSGLEANGQPVRITGDYAQIRGGALVAQFQVRDELAVEAQADLDAVARDLIERFESPGLDPTVTATDPGVFTDGGARFDVTAVTGLASRIELNTSVDPNAGGDSWKLRAGLGAATPGDPGDASQLQAFGAILDDTRPVSGASFGTGTLRAAEIAEALLSKAGTDAHRAEQRQSFAASAQQEMEQIVAEQGVDSDAELQRLILIEQAYSANAQIITVVNELMDTLLRI
ncbi:flagellar hook-associated protein FlgK [Ruegeria sp.]|uniref:flagellar hook-associated protein FlgK n=1 Tax=Ruegeria sp. TaxID=1879320 RepID=UPI00232532E1|nr:flagellar hook-associated protein FlgK [Ruegeria sp.]MDA7964348.1 flagellar hook-associated protein FlgK [Ruegeria sp.]